MSETDPTPSEHLSDARKNEDLAGDIQNIGKGKSNGWTITIYFYSALHYVDGKLAEDEITTENHGDRKQKIKHHISDRSLYQNYKELKCWSEKSRYKCWEASEDQVAFSKDDLSLIKSSLGYSD